MSPQFGKFCLSANGHNICNVDVSAHCPRHSKILEKVIGTVGV